MRTAAVATNETCNHRCWFCDARREHERASVAAPVAIARRIDEAGAAEIVLTGGEPTLRRDLPRWVARARGHGVRVILESNGTGIDDALVPALVDAGLGAVRLHVPGHRHHQAVTGDPHGWQRLVDAAARLGAAGIGVEATVPLVEPILDEVATLPAVVRAELPAVALLRARAIVRAGDGRTNDPVAVARGFERLADAARRVELPVQLDPAGLVPPCLLTRPQRHAHAYALGPGGSRRDAHVRLPQCAACVVADRCPGMPAPWRGPAHGVAVAITDERTRRRLSIVEAVDKQIAREMVTDEQWRRADGTSVPARIIRIGFRCNQACRFCFVSTHLPAPPVDRVAAAIDEQARRGGAVILSGGEPTLDPEVVSWVRRAKAGGAIEVELQTNATRIDDALAGALAEAGLDTAFVSLHGATATISDAVTDAPGTFHRTLEGIDALVRTRVAVRLNYVLCRINHHELPAMVELVADRWPTAAVTVSFVAPSSDLVPHTPELVPRYADVMPAVVQALAIARQRGLEIGGFESMCGVPLCLLPDDVRDRFASLAVIDEDIAAGEMVTTEACERCRLRPRCHGVRRGYAELHGTSELRPVLG
jgi:MoaA/NifB/PqqE/SkfB family radical SAM enzyme